MLGPLRVGRGQGGIHVGAVRVLVLGIPRPFVVLVVLVVFVVFVVLVVFVLLSLLSPLSPIVRIFRSIVGSLFVVFFGQHA